MLPKEKFAGLHTCILAPLFLLRYISRRRGECLFDRLLRRRWIGTMLNRLRCNSDHQPHNGKWMTTGFSHFSAPASIRLTMKSATSAREMIPLRHAVGFDRTRYLPLTGPFVSRPGRTISQSKSLPAISVSWIDLSS